MDPHEFKLCRGCGEEKTLEFFYTRRDGSSRCMACEKRQKSESPARKNRVAERQRAYFEYLSQHPCVDCGEGDIVVLEPDHLPTSKKRFNVSRLLKSGHRWQTVLEELAKCEIVCRNCHARRTHRRNPLGTSKLAFLESACSL